MNIALVHDYLVQYGGAERVLENFCELFPHAPIYTLIYDEKATHGRFRNRRIYTSFLQQWPLSKSRHRLFPLFMPSAIESFDFSRYDVVLSDSSSFAKGIITPSETLHICYMHTPMRYVWDDCQRYAREFHYPKPVKLLVPFFVNAIRLWDKASADRPDKIIANSTFVAERIGKYYRREAEVIHPPVNIDAFHTGNRGEYFLMVGRLIAYKRHDIAIEAFNRSGLPLTIIGRGPEEARLRKQAKANIRFLGRVSDEKLVEYYANCRAFLFPQEEDFGIVAIEAIASGKPVIAYRGGDIIRHIREGSEGVFFDKQTPQAIIDAVDRFEQQSFDAEAIRASSKRFDASVFQKNIAHFVEAAFTEHRKRTIS
jgi:glycosyltransferase involved in cell wall biosynthesis